MRIGIGSDQSGYGFKECLKVRLAGQSHAVEDFNASHLDASRYCDVTDQLALAIRARRIERGVLICTGAIGACVAANKCPAVRAALCHDLYSAKRGVQDDNLNLLVLEPRLVTYNLASRLADAFIGAVYVGRERAFGIPPRRLARVLEYVRNNLDKPLGVVELSELAEMSQSHFSKLFRRSTDLTPHQFVLNERINRSKELLRQGKTKIVDIALEVGFQNQAHFTTVFGNHVGVTPLLFQRSSYHIPVDAGITKDARRSPDLAIVES